jgi:hypothetical protein
MLLVSTPGFIEFKAIKNPLFLGGGFDVLPGVAGQNG